MITEVWDVDNGMIDQVWLNTVTYHSWTPQNSALMFKASNEHWGSEFFVIFNSKSRIYNMSNKFWSHLIIIFFNQF